MYVVVVDDDDTDIRRITECLPECHFTEVAPFTKVEDLRNLLAQITSGEKPEPALVLLDMKIGRDGEAGLKMLQEVRQTIPHMPVIIVSQSKLRTVIVESFKRGAASYIHKSQREGVFEHRIAEMFLHFSGISKIPATAELSD